MIFFAALFFFVAVFGAVSLFLFSVRRTHLSAHLVLSFAFFLAIEAVILNLLSLFKLVNRTGMLAAHLLLVSVLFYSVAFSRPANCLVYLRALSLFVRRRCRNAFVLLFVPVVFILLLIALTNPPTTHDSLTYHMGRVAHWIQQQSIAYFPTNISRQNELGPGAEYLVLFFQLLTNSDVLAGMVQFFCFLLLPAGLFYLLRTTGVDRAFVPWIILLSLSSPMAMMQATTTQNDLVSSLMTLAILIACSRLFRGSLERLAIWDYVVIAVTLAGGFLVKPIALIVAFPFLILGLFFNFQGMASRKAVALKTLAGAAVVIVVFLAVAGPDLFRKVQAEVSRHEVYPLFSQWDHDRLLNPIRTMGQNTPWPDLLRRLLRSAGYEGELVTGNVFSPHQSVVGNPVQFLALLFLTFLNICLVLFAFFGKARGKKLRLFLFSMAPVLSWCMFSWTVKNQFWLTRLQLPLFFVMPFAFLYPLFMLKRWKYLRLGVYGVLVAASLFSVSYSSFAVMNNTERTLTLKRFWGQDTTDRYGSDKYSNDDNDMDFFLRASRGRCNRIGFLGAENIADYPLVWRAMLQGQTVRHVFQENIDSWPCMVFVGRGVLEHLPNKGTQWIALDDYNTWERNGAYEYERATLACRPQQQGDLLHGLTAGVDTFIDRKDDAVVLQSNGNDPHVFLPQFSCDGATTAVLHVSLYSPVKTKAQLFYHTAENQDYSLMNSRIQRISAGMNDLFFLLPADAITGRLRFDPGLAAGKYTIMSMDCRAVQENGVIVQAGKER